MKNLGFLLLLLIVMNSCKDQTVPSLSAGTWRGTMEVQDGQLLPFNFSIGNGSEGYIMEIYNADEVLSIDEIIINNDSIIIKMPVFEGYISGRFTNSIIEGNFIKESLDRVVPFTANFNDSTRFVPSKAAAINVQGNWEAVFSKGTEDAYVAKGIFKQDGEKVTGTIRTTTGDYRYLEGVVDGDSLKLSTFDGTHVFLFLARINDGIMNGTFYSGNHFQEPFEAVPNESYELPDATTLTYLNEGYERVNFSFPDINGNLITLDDHQFQDKVVIIQIMGTWCPNCLDESKFLVEYLKENSQDDLEVIALAFEYAKTEEAAFKGINRLKNRLGISYPILLAQYGSSDKKTANEKLPMLNHILSYPTTIFIDKESEVRRIHTGFNGPATGETYIEFKQDFKEFVNSLIAE
ncbi:peroxiredoxin [uncultured Muriicola sp.]|uniref:peroxiredoxin family protein n=1 Tax=uncultured Muriicola sp. TaxID=1583102 RepID=UPI0026365C93|nr:TlpA disulfide reductase family protein [uncultured Muriicola sp.]